MFRLSGDWKPAAPPFSDSVYSLDRMREATIQIRVPVGSPIILRAHDKRLSHSVRYACSETSLRHFIQAFFERLVMSQHCIADVNLYKMGFA